MKQLQCLKNNIFLRLEYTTWMRLENPPSRKVQHQVSSTNSWERGGRKRVATSLVLECRCSVRFFLQSLTIEGEFWRGFQLNYRMVLVQWAGTFFVRLTVISWCEDRLLNTKIKLETLLEWVSGKITKKKKEKTLNYLKVYGGRGWGGRGETKESCN